MFSSDNTFAIYTGLGAAIGLWQVQRRAQVCAQFLRLGQALFILVGALTGARVGYVLFHWNFFRGQGAEIFQLSRGGLDWVGAVVGGWFGLFLVWKISGEHLGSLADSLAPLAIPLTAGAWLGCWDSGCAYGMRMDTWPGWLVPDELGIIARRFPLQLLAVLMLATGAIWLETRSPRVSHSGQYACRVGLWFSATQLLTAFPRGASAPLFFGLRPDVWAGLVFTILSAAAAWKSGLFSRREDPPASTTDSMPGIN